MIINEGKIKINVPDKYFLKGPGRQMPGFYNADQKFNRDVTVSFIRFVRPRLALDAFGGTGVRGIRINVETGTRTVISEINKKSFEYIEKNINENNADVEAYNEGFECVLDKYLFDYIDIDPYGSIVPYIDKAISRIRNHGYIGITATDLTALTGSNVQKLKRRYNAFALNDSFRHETGIRILIAFFVRHAAAMDRGAFPLISLWHSHYYRIFFKIENGSLNADKALSMIGYYNKKNGIYDYYNDVNEGEMWLGEINRDASMIDYKIERLCHDDESIYFIELKDISRFRNSDQISIKRALKILEENGINGYRTQFSDTGIKVKDKKSAFELIA
ncbi:tRNA (guanine(26)-N(2))-dimethyltransferase [Picrophilus oshimae]|uniref:tRNA (guanine(26)-N(2))-dimethyltransferase n=1 Tax=Picrophilus torridus (strain ATCC 700027 / DSM 9790 / JCM 10055 / NBRC 100828 / KAW 2/3) TaxID=1122961 RepID=Q6L2J7_PICTO|nr:tRNA (guanine(26)-N(2))-dimethyltransferase [Picrophilus oshimae]AAT42805.1 N2,N2-dimethylguanosine tRNA methyltransferase [Picrophilus oshimae DSM 9789]SMD31566.1 N(2),N(2)-dimethylguanosine tRNA methyltransferase [Picrophilus oshimae DSM 9789]